jgi:hypothetical protein
MLTATDAPGAFFSNERAMDSYNILKYFLYVTVHPVHGHVRKLRINNKSHKVVWNPNLSSNPNYRQLTFEEFCVWYGIKMLADNL